MPRYVAPINMRATGGVAANSTIWSIRAGGTTPLNIRRIVLFAAFDGTAASSSAIYELMRFDTATPSGGTPITAVPLDLGSAASTAANIQQSPTMAALTVTGVNFHTPLMTGAACPRGATGSVVAEEYAFEEAPIVLRANEGLAIQISAAAVAGDVLGGFIEWEE